MYSSASGSVSESPQESRSVGSVGPLISLSLPAPSAPPPASPLDSLSFVQCPSLGLCICLGQLLRGASQSTATPRLLSASKTGYHLVSETDSCQWHRSQAGPVTPKLGQPLAGQSLSVPAPFPSQNLLCGMFREQACVFISLPGVPSGQGR